MTSFRIAMSIAALAAALALSAGTPARATAAGVETVPAGPIAGGVSPATLPAPKLSWSATYAGWYSFQGIDYSNGLPVLQPGVSAELGLLTASAWGNFDQDLAVMNEMDLGLVASFERGPLSGSAGYLYLQYPHRDGWLPSHELLVDLECAVPLQPSLSLHWDVAEGDGRYATLGLGHEFPLGSGTATLGAKLHVQDRYYAMSGIPGAETALSLSFSTGAVVLQPSLGRVWTWENGDFRGDAGNNGGWLASLTVSSP